MRCRVSPVVPASKIETSILFMAQSISCSNCNVKSEQQGIKLRLSNILCCISPTRLHSWMTCWFRWVIFVSNNRCCPNSYPPLPPLPCPCRLLDATKLRSFSAEGSPYTAQASTLRILISVNNKQNSCSEKRLSESSLQPCTSKSLILTYIFWKLLLRT